MLEMILFQDLTWLTFPPIFLLTFCILRVWRMEFTTEFGNDPSISETSFFHSLGLQTADRTDDLSQINSAIEDSSLGRNIETMSHREHGAGQSSDMSFFDAIGKENMLYFCNLISIFWVFLWSRSTNLITISSILQTVKKVLKQKTIIFSTNRKRNMFFYKVYIGLTRPVTNLRTGSQNLKLPLVLPRAGTVLLNLRTGYRNLKLPLVLPKAGTVLLNQMTGYRNLKLVLILPRAGTVILHYARRAGSEDQPTRPRTDPKPRGSRMKGVKSCQIQFFLF